jgi:hypothetical protein
MKLWSIALAAVAISSSAMAAGTYFPRYASSDGGIVEFNKLGFSVTEFDDAGDYSYICKRLSSITTSLHWGQCEGGDKFIFTLDPKHPETMKIGDVVYKECGKMWDKC